MFQIKRALVKIGRLSDNLKSFSTISTKKCELIFATHNCSRNMLLIRNCSSTTTENPINYEAITGGDKELEHKLKVIELETEVMRQEGKAIPEMWFMKEQHWKELLKFETRTARSKYLQFLFKNSKKQENKNIKKEQRRIEFEEYKSTRPEQDKENETIEEFASKYDLQHNNLFLRIYDQTINQMYNNRLVQAMQFGQKIVVDCGYDQDMSKRENANCAKQIMLLFAENRFHDDPFDLHLCNANLNESLMEYFHKHVPPMLEKWFPLNVHESSYLDLFPKEKLVYLTPHCREEITEFDHDAIYIIGGIVDKVNNTPLSLAKAKRENIRMAKLPLDKYLQWGTGSGKSLTLNQVISILLDVKKTNDWKYALRHVPRRKLEMVTNTSNVRDRVPQDTSPKIPRTTGRWTPSHNNVDLSNLSYNNRDKDRQGDVAKRVRIRSLFDE